MGWAKRYPSRGAHHPHSGARIFQNFPHLRAQAVAHAPKRIELQILFATFDGAVVSPVHADRIGEPFLAVAGGFPARPEGLSQALKKRAVGGVGFVDPAPANP